MIAALDVVFIDPFTAEQSTQAVNHAECLHCHQLSAMLLIKYSHAVLEAEC